MRVIILFTPETKRHGEKWLEKNHKAKDSVWLIIYKKGSGISSVYYPEAVDEALCFGWIDSLPNKRDDKSYFLFFSKRSLKSKWSRVNKLKIEKLYRENKMMPQGLKMIEYAKQNGTWDALNQVDELVIPDALAHLFESNTEAKKNFSNFPPSVKRGILEWILNAKQEVTKLKRITQTAELAARNIRANQYKPKV